MCLLAFAYETVPNYSLVFAGNRDEFYERPTAPAAYWDDAPHVLAGRDRKAGGTWMGVTRRGHWGVVTNIREPGAYAPDAPSRGALVADYLRAEPAPKAYLQSVAAEADRYNGFNLLLGTPESLYYLNNRGSDVRPVEPGVHGLSNDRLDTPWLKVERATHGLRRRLDRGDPTPEALLDLLDDRRSAPTEALPDTGVGPDRERMLSPIFIESERYGTRASTVLLVGRDGTITFVERSFDRGAPTETRRFSFEVPVGSGV
ncbi:MAG: NRDE family protein [Salinibacter sp.]